MIYTSPISMLYLTLFSLLLASILFAIWIFYIKKRKIPKSRIELTVTYLFIVYCIAVAYIAFSSINSENTYNSAGSLVNSDNLFEAFKYRLPYIAMPAFFNILMFIPLGIAMFFFFRNKKHRLIKSIVIICATTVLIEIMQLLFTTFRIPDINDILLNSFGGFIGCSLFYIVECIKYKRFKTKQNIMRMILPSLVLVFFAVFFVIPVFTPNELGIKFIDSKLFFTPNITISNAESIEYPKNAYTYTVSDDMDIFEFLYGNNRPGNIVSVTDVEQESEKGNLAVKDTVDILSPSESIEQAKKGLIIDIYTEGISYPDKFIVKDFNLKYCIKDDCSEFIPIYECSGVLYKDGETENFRMRIPAIGV